MEKAISPREILKDETYGLAGVKRKEINHLLIGGFRELNIECPVDIAKALAEEYEKEGWEVRLHCANPTIGDPTKKPQRVEIFFSVKE